MRTVVYLKFGEENQNSISDLLYKPINAGKAAEESYEIKQYLTLFAV